MFGCFKLSLFVTFADFLCSDDRFKQLVEFVQLFLLVRFLARLFCLSLGHLHTHTHAKTCSYTRVSVRHFHGQEEEEVSSDLSGTLLSIFHLLSDVLDVFLLFGPFLVLQSKSLVLGKKNKQQHLV